MQPAGRGGLVVGRQHIDGVKGCQQLIGPQQQLKDLQQAILIGLLASVPHSLRAQPQ